MLHQTHEIIVNYMLESDDYLSDLSDSDFENVVGATDVSSGEEIAAISDETNKFTAATTQLDRKNEHWLTNQSQTRKKELKELMKSKTRLQRNLRKL